MKKFIPFISIVAFALLFTGVALAAGVVPDCEFIGGVKGCNWTHIFGSNGIFNKLLVWITTTAVSVATLAILWAGIVMVTSQGNQSKYGEAKDLLWLAVKGLVVSLAAYLVIMTIIRFFVSGFSTF